MEDYDYGGYRIYVTLDGYFQVKNYEFPTLEEAMDWIDAQDDAMPEEKSNKYIIFYIDRSTDKAFQVCIEAKSYKEAERILRKNYDVYMIADYYKID